jgi:thiamine-monophosphate kinase
MASQPTVADLGERAIVDLIRSRVPAAPRWVALGIGDDAAVFEPARNTLDVLTADALIEGVHFDRRVAPPGAIGHKALAVSLSDLAAMGAEPRAALLSLGLPPTLPAGDVDQLVEGVLALAARFKTALVGGNVSRSPGPLIVDVTAVGSVRRRRLLARSGAKPGDVVFVSGWIGRAAAGLASCAARAGAGLLAACAGTVLTPCEAHFLRPEPRVRLGLLLGRGRVASACIDLSDGLADGLTELCRASGTGVVVDAEAIPIDDPTREWFAGRGADVVESACAGGEDYELLFTVPPRRVRAFEAVRRLAGDLPCARIGTITPGGACVLRREGIDGRLPRGFAHFR